MPAARAILVVGMPPNAADLAQALAATGFEASCCFPSELAGRLRRATPDALVVAATERVQASLVVARTVKTTKVPVFVALADADDDQRARCLAAGAADVSPAETPAELAARLGAALEGWARAEPRRPFGGTVRARQARRGLDLPAVDIDPTGIGIGPVEGLAREEPVAVRLSLGLEEFVVWGRAADSGDGPGVRFLGLSAAERSRIAAAVERLPAVSGGPGRGSIPPSPRPPELAAVAAGGAGHVSIPPVPRPAELAPVSAAPPARARPPSVPPTFVVPPMPAAGAGHVTIPPGPRPTELPPAPPAAAPPARVRPPSVPPTFVVPPIPAIGQARGSMPPAPRPPELAAALSAPQAPAPPASVATPAAGTTSQAPAPAAAAGGGRPGSGGKTIGALFDDVPGLDPVLPPVPAAPAPTPRRDAGLPRWPASVFSGPSALAALQGALATGLLPVDGDAPPPQDARDFAHMLLASEIKAFAEPPPPDALVPARVRRVVALRLRLWATVRAGERMRRETKSALVVADELVEVLSAAVAEESAALHREAEANAVSNPAAARELVRLRTSLTRSLLEVRSYASRASWPYEAPAQRAVMLDVAVPAPPEASAAEVSPRPDRSRPPPERRARAKERDELAGLERSRRRLLVLVVLLGLGVLGLVFLR